MPRHHEGEFLIDARGGIHRFPRQPGVYLIEHEPTGGTYVGATCTTVRQGVEQQIKPTRAASRPSWAVRLAQRLMEDELLPPYSGDDLADFERHVRRNCTARVLELLPFDVTDDQISTAENRWLAELRPSLNHMQRSNYGR